MFSNEISRSDFGGVVRVASFNLENLGAEGKTGVATMSRLGVLRPQLERLNADILCLQEVNAERVSPNAARSLAPLELLIETTAYKKYELAHSTDADTGELSEKHNLVILSRWPIVEKRQIWHDYVTPANHLPISAIPPAEKPSQITWDRPLLSCRVQLPNGHELHLLNLHLRAPLAAPIAGRKFGPFSWKTSSAWAEGFYLAMLKRSGQALETRIEIDRILDNQADARILVCGDFNASEHEVPSRIIAASVEDTANGELADRALMNLERSVPQSQRFSVLHHGERLMMDHILISRALLGAYRHFEVHNELLSDELFGFAAIGKNPESYHAPVVAEFDLESV